jgi:hypothetical protein
LHPCCCRSVFCCWPNDTGVHVLALVHAVASTLQVFLRLLDGWEAKIVFCNSVRSIAELYVTMPVYLNHLNHFEQLFTSSNKQICWRLI